MHPFLPILYSAQRQNRVTPHPMTNRDTLFNPSRTLDLFLRHSRVPASAHRTLSFSLLMDIRSLLSVVSIGARVLRRSKSMLSLILSLVHQSIFQMLRPHSTLHRPRTLWEPALLQGLELRNLSSRLQLMSRCFVSGGPSCLVAAPSCRLRNRTR